MPSTAVSDNDTDFERYVAAAETFVSLLKTHDAALLSQPGGAAKMALRRLKVVRREAAVSFPGVESEPRAGDVNFAAEAEDTERACAKLRSKIDALALGASEKSPDDGATAKELTAKVDAFRKTLKTLEAEAEKAADAVAKAEAAAQVVAERGRQLKTEVDQEIAAAKARLGP